MPVADKWAYILVGDTAVRGSRPMGSVKGIQHIGVVLEPSQGGFDAAASTFGFAFLDDPDAPRTYLFYSGANDPEWSHAAIGVAVSNDGRQFEKLKHINPVIDGRGDQFNSQESVTPVVVRMGSYYHMFFGASAKDHPHARGIGAARADDPLGPWTTLGTIAKPEEHWEGSSIDLGPSEVKIDETEVLLYYSNVNIRMPSRIPFVSRSCRRSVGILKVKVLSAGSIEGLRYHGNPLKHLNGPSGSPSENLFCPGHFTLESMNYLVPGMCTYSVGFPFRQYIGLFSDGQPYFQNAGKATVLIDGPTMKNEILPRVVDELALDSPCPVVKEDCVHLYYSVMDRHDGLWKTALSLIEKDLFSS